MYMYDENASVLLIDLPRTIKKIHQIPSLHSFWSVNSDEAMTPIYSLSH